MRRYSLHARRGDVGSVGVQEWRHSASGESRADETNIVKAKRKVLVYTPSNEVITSYSHLQRHLYALGWERYYENAHLLQFHKASTVHLISLPTDFSKFKSMHMYDIVVKNRNMFQVRDM
ncbi:hypothetical protein Bca52824_068199 [Brassica carinata]|uniref:Flowering-promoting factor 1-like protein 3 n=1 Tax=Brassica carinata TaxID=52824 RepID=A0A8X7TZW8_BRACI|nr:hypothetical protein Bca52824_068199 [Brassica carinata]